MSLEAFRNLCSELKYIPDDEEEILEDKSFTSKYFVAKCLSNAMKALKIADEIIMKQADAILDSNKELTFCLQNFRCNNEYAIKTSMSNKFGGNIV